MATKSNVWNTLLKSIAALGLTYVANKAVDSSTSWVDTRNQIIVTAVTSVATELAKDQTAE